MSASGQLHAVVERLHDARDLVDFERSVGSDAVLFAEPRDGKRRDREQEQPDCAGRQDEADDIAQEALTKAWASRASFTPSSPLRAWLLPS